MTAQPRHYQRIYESLKQQISAGTYPVGTLIPSENELSAQFQTSRMTVRQALAELVREGYIDRRHGKGSIVRSERKALGLLSFQGFSDVVGHHHQVRTDYLDEPVIRPWPVPFFYELTTTEKILNCLSMNRIRYADNSPVMLEYTWAPDIGLGTLLTDGLLDGSLFRTLHSRFQLDIRSMDQTLRAVAATPQQATLFGCAKKAPLLAIKRRYVTSRPDLHIYSQLYCFTDQYAISGGL